MTGPALPVELRIWNAMTGDERIQVAKAAGALTGGGTALRSLRKCHAYIRAHLDLYRTPEGS